MGIFIVINDTNLNKAINVNVEHITSYSVSKDNPLCIVYKLKGNILLSECFSTEEERDNKLTSLGALSVQ